MPDLHALAEDYDAWRDAYDDLTFDDQKRIYERIRELHPQQRHFTIAQAYPFFDRYQPKTVIEVGGWDGWLAACVLGQHQHMRRWQNFDLAHVPQTCIDPRYTFTVLAQPFWEHRKKADAFVATHTIEHVKEAELRRIVGCLDVKCALIEAPLEDGPTDWDGFIGTHILEVGWKVVDRIFKEHGFSVAHRWDRGRFYAG